MGFWSRLFGGGGSSAPKRRAPWVEYQGPPIADVPLYPRGEYQVERDGLVPEGRRRKWVWVDLSTRPQAKGELVGQPVIVARVNGRVIGELPPKYREQYPWVFDAVLGGVNVATVRLSVGETINGNTTADMTLGAHQYQPRRPHDPAS